MASVNKKQLAFGYDFTDAAVAAAGRVTGQTFTAIPTQTAYIPLESYTQLKGEVYLAPGGTIKYWWIQAGTRDRFDDAVNAIKTQKCVPFNRFETIWISSQIGTDVAQNVNGGYTIHYKKVNFIPWQSYLNDLESTSDKDSFIDKLVLCEAAGLCLGYKDPADRGLINYASQIDTTQVPATDPTTGLPYNLSLWGSYEHTNPRDVQQGLIGMKYWDKYNPLDNKQRPGTHAPTMILNDDMSVRDENKIKTNLGIATYRGYNTTMLQQYCEQVARYQERILTYVMEQSFLALNIAQLEDEKTVEITLRQLIRLMDTEKARIRQSRNITVTWADGSYTTKTVSLSDFTGLIPVQPVGQPFSVQMSVQDALLYICESAFFYGAWKYTLLKMGSRINQLSDPTAFITEVGPTSFGLDPWRNPFLIPNIDKSDASGVATYDNTAASIAVQATKEVTSKIVRPIDVKKAPSVLKSYTRLPSSSGNAYSPNEGGSNTTSAPWALLAAAAGVGVLMYMQNK